MEGEDKTVLAAASMEMDIGQEDQKDQKVC